MAPPLTTLYTLSFTLALLTTLAVAASLRLLAVLPRARPHKTQLRARLTSARLLVVLGSGGHTHEMFALLRDLDPRKYVHRTYVVGDGDVFSVQRAVAFERDLEGKWGSRQDTFEKELEGKRESKQDTNATNPNVDRRPCVGPQHYTITTIPRARRVHQSLVSTPLSALRTLAAAFAPLLSSSPGHLPNLVVTNGPANAVILILAALVLRFFNIRGAESRGLCRTMYVESFARVKTLSLSGKLLVRVVDRFLVQWAELEGFAGRAEYCGILV